MADLDDFFAKKDRKKGKSKKFATPDELAKKLEDTTKKAEIKVRKEPQPAQSDGVEAESGEQPTVPEVCFLWEYFPYCFASQREHYSLCTCAFLTDCIKLMANLRVRVSVDAVVFFWHVYIVKANVVFFALPYAMTPIFFAYK